MIYFILKSLHIIGFVAWFSGLFYLGRILVYHRESQDGEESIKSILNNQYHLMETRAYSIIAQPAMIITWICGVSMIFLNGYDWFVENYWLHVKIVLLICFTIFHLRLKFYIKTLFSSTSNLTSYHFRLLNEVPTLFLFSIVFLAVFKNLLHFGYALLGVTLLGVFLIAATKWYKSIRQKNNL